METRPAEGDRHEVLDFSLLVEREREKGESMSDKERNKIILGRGT